MAALRPAEREALQLVHWEELSHAEAAAVIGCTVNAFELRYRRARRAVRAAVASATAPSGPITSSGSVASIQISDAVGRHAQ